MIGAKDTQDPFTGTWTFCPERSKLSTPPPASWVQYIDVTSEELRVREEIVTANGSHLTVTVEAKFDGNDYPVSGSPAADAIAYDRVDAFTISGIGKKSGAISLRETLTATPGRGALTMTYSVCAGTLEVANGIAVFEREP